MDSSVPAFSVYKANIKKGGKKNNAKKRQKNKTTTQVPNANSIPENVILEAAQKLKRVQQKVKETNIIKKKTHKKNKSKFNKKRNQSVDSEAELNTTNVDIRKRHVSKNEDVPVLIPAKISKHPISDIEDDIQSDLNNCAIEFVPVQTNSVEEGLKTFKWMIAPYDPDIFLKQIWEKEPLYISRKKAQYYKGLISTSDIDKMLRNENLQFTKNIDVSCYVNGRRELYNPEGRAYPHTVWDYYLSGSSIRLKNPQTYIGKLHLLNATLQEFFNSFVGANAYLTPPDSQGFAPHYDDIEAFILQTEGKKHWKIYKPLNEKEVLPRVSSKNYDQSAIGEPFMEVTLEAGDMIYFPRGYIHQGVTIDGEHSLHVTISMYQKHSWADLFEKLIPGALQTAIAKNVDLRKGLPFDIYDNFGLIHSDVNTPRRKEIEALIKSLFDKIKDHLPIDDAVDLMYKNYMHDALPPVLSDSEQAVTVFSHDTDLMVKNGRVINRVKIDLDTRIRLLRKNIVRMVYENDIKLYYYVENSKENHGNELLYIEIEEQFASGIETLITSYPEYVLVEDLDIVKNIDKIRVAEELWSKGIIMTEYPLETIDD